MAVTKKDYKTIDKLAIDIYVDYGITSFPLDIYGLAKKMGAKLIKYSSFDDDQRELLLKKSNDGFFVDSPKGPLIFYNDRIEYQGKINLTIAHELKHFICKDEKEDEDSEKLADHFGRFLLCPTPYLIYSGIDDIYEIMDMFGLTYSAAINAHNATINRKHYYGNKIFDYEQALVDLFI